MTITRSQRGLSSERGEGTLRLVVFLGLLGLAGYIAITNVPTYFATQNLRTELKDLARGSGVQGMSADKVGPRAAKIARDYNVSPSDVKVEQDGKGIKITLNTTKQFNFIVTSYDWHVSEVYTQQPF